MTKKENHDAAIKRVAEQYQANGFAVLIEPSGEDCPAFLGNYRPDLIAKSATKSVVVEVKIGTDVAYGERFRSLAERIAQEPGWEFSLVVIAGQEFEAGSSLEKLPTAAQVKDRTDRALALSKQGNLEAAFLLLWGCLESTLRLLSVECGLPLRNAPPSAILRELYSAGELSNVQYEQAMQLLKIRNSLVHGYVRPTEVTDIELLGKIVLELLQELKGD